MILAFWFSWGQQDEIHWAKKTRHKIGAALDDSSSRKDHFSLDDIFHSVVLVEKGERDFASKTDSLEPLKFAGIYLLPRGNTERRGRVKCYTIQVAPNTNTTHSNKNILQKEIFQTSLFELLNRVTHTSLPGEWNLSGMICIVVVSSFILSRPLHAFVSLCLPSPNWTVCAADQSFLSVQRHFSVNLDSSVALIAIQKQLASSGLFFLPFSKFTLLYKMLLFSRWAWWTHDPLSPERLSSALHSPLQQQQLVDILLPLQRQPLNNTMWNQYDLKAICLSGVWASAHAFERRRHSNILRRACTWISAASASWTRPNSLHAAASLKRVHAHEVRLQPVHFFGFGSELTSVRTAHSTNRGDHRAGETKNKRPNLGLVGQLSAKRALQILRKRQFCSQQSSVSKNIVQRDSCFAGKLSRWPAPVLYIQFGNIRSRDQWLWQTRPRKQKNIRVQLW